MGNFMYYIGQVIGYLVNMVVSIAKYFKGYFVILVLYIGTAAYLIDLDVLLTWKKAMYLAIPLIWWILFEMRTRQHTHERMFNPTIRYCQHFIMNTKIFWKGD